MEYELYNTGELYHHGTKGMRWGIRRYQNKDGSLTNAGKRRYQKELDAVRKEEKILKNRKSTASKLAKLDARKQKLAEGKKELDGDESRTNKLSKKDAKKAAKQAAAEQAKKSIKDMTDEELIYEISRARLEDTYRQLRPEQKVEKHPMMKKMVNEVLVPAAVSSGKKFLESALNKAAEKVLGGKVDPNSLEALKKTYEKLDYKQKIDKMLNPDKYLSEEDKTKRADREYKAEDRKAQMEGYANAADKARKTRNESTRATNENDSKVYEGTVEGFGKSSKTTNQGKKWTTDSKVYDAEYWTVTDDDNTSSGRSYVSNYLALPAPKRSSARDDD